MYPRTPYLIIKIFILLIFSSIVPKTVMSIELPSYVIDAIDANPRVREKIHVYRQTLQDKESSLSGWRPSIDLEGTISRVESDTITNNSQSDDYNSNRVELAVSQNLFNGFDTKYSIKQADARINAALYDLYDTVDNVALEAIQAYLEVIKQKQLYKLAQVNVESHEETLRQISERDRSGAGRRSELEQTEGRVARAFASMLAQHNNLEDSLIILHEVLGRYIDVNDFIDPLIPVGIEDSLPVLTDKALHNHPAMKVAQYNIEAARHDHRRAKSSFYPRLDLRLAQEINDNIDDSRDNDDELSLSLTLSYNLYNGGADQAERRKRVSTISQEQQFEGRVRRQIINTLSLAQKADLLLQKQLGYLNMHVVKSQETMVSYREEFFVGERDLIDLLDAKGEVNSAQNSYSEAYYDAVAARFRIYEGIGDLFEALGLKVEIENDDLQISRIQASGVDTIAASLNIDFDQDSVLDRFDQCDNSLSDVSVDKFGCKPLLKSIAYQPNTPPLAVDDSWDVPRNGVLTLSVEMLLANDSDGDNDEINLVNFSQPTKGQIAMDEENRLVYRAADGFAGADSFSYTISDESGASSTATVTILIQETVSLTQPQFVNFEHNSTDMTDASNSMVDQIVLALKENPDLKLSISTYTDSRGSEKYNMSLSERRAKSITAMLKSKGILKERFIASAKGESNPIADNNTPEGRAINRRGEFIFQTVNPQ